MIPFHVPYHQPEEWLRWQTLIGNGSLSGDGIIGKQVEANISGYLGAKTLLTTSCTHALEMAALLMDAAPGDEVIMPSYTFMSTANAFVLRGMVPVFADSYADHPNMNPESVLPLISPKTKALVVVHYGGFPCDMEVYREICNQHGLLLIEDAAHALGVHYQGKPLGTWGDMAAFSFHDTKNLSCGEGGAFVTTQEKFEARAEIIREKGTNRSAFMRGEAAFYTWVDKGSSYVLSEMQAALLQLRWPKLAELNEVRLKQWWLYFNALKHMEQLGLMLPPPPTEKKNHNGHLFYVKCPSQRLRDALKEHLMHWQIGSAFHYQALHSSPFSRSMGFYKNALPNAEAFSTGLLRLPLYPSLSSDQQQHVIDAVLAFRP